MDRTPIAASSRSARGTARSRLYARGAAALAFSAILVNLLTVIRGKAFWIDEWFIIYILKYRSTASLFGPLDFIQEFPRLYLALVQAFVRTFHYAAFSYRLIPFLVQSANVALLWIIGRRYLWPGRVRRSAFLLLLFVGNLMTIFYFSKIKHYTMDLFISLLAFLQFALLVEWVRRPRFDRKLAFILAVAALGPFFSYAYEYFAVPVLLVAAFHLLESFRRGRPDWLTGLPLAVFLAALTLAFQVNLKYTLSNTAQQGAFAEYFVSFHSPGLFLRGAARGFLEFFSGFLFVPESLQKTPAAFLLGLGRYGFGLLTLLGLGRAGRRLFRTLRPDRSGDGIRPDFGPEFFFCVATLVAGILFLARKIPLGLARLDYFAFLPLAYFAVEGLAAVLGHPRSLVRAAGRAVLAGLIIFFSAFFVKANWNELRGRAPGYDQAAFDNIGRAIRRAYEADAALLVLGDVPLDPSVAIANDDPRKSASRTNQVNRLILMAHPAFRVERPLPILAIDSLADLGRLSRTSSDRRLVLVKPRSFREWTPAASTSPNKPRERGDREP